jgi:hypothetical protein
MATLLQGRHRPHNRAHNTSQSDRHTTSQCKQLPAHISSGSDVVDDLCAGERTRTTQTKIYRLNANRSFRGAERES